MSNYASPFVASLDPYQPGEQPREGGFVKLNTNENPYPPAPTVYEVLHSADAERLRLYPDPESVDLRNAIAGHHGLTADNVFAGNGSDEVLGHAFNAFFRQSRPILFPDITYSFYPVYANLYGIDYKQLPLNADFEIDFSQYRELCGGVIFANPNAPTGILKSLNAVKALLQAQRDVVVVVDEAYIDFAPDGASASSLLAEFDNLLVVQTLSKSRSLAGLRVGYALGSEALIAALNTVKNSFNSYPVNALSAALGSASFADPEYFRKTCKRIIDSRDALMAELSALGFNSLPSCSNFVMTSHLNIQAGVLAQKLRDQKILVRYFNTERLDNYLRITIGNEQQNAELLTALRQIVKSING
jgi:histidinol-phosphate aminotransferase